MEGRQKHRLLNLLPSSCWSQRSLYDPKQNPVFCGQRMVQEIIFASLTSFWGEGSAVRESCLAQKQLSGELNIHETQMIWASRLQVKAKPDLEGQGKLPPVLLRVSLHGL